MYNCKPQRNASKVPTRKLKLDINDGEGNKISITITGKLNRDKILQVLDFVELLNGSSTSTEKRFIADLSKFEKLQLIIERKFPIGWFTSQELMIAYEDVLDEPIGLSTVSTYLYRLAEKRILVRAGSLAERKYKLARSQRPGKRTFVQT